VDPLLCTLQSANKRKNTERNGAPHHIHITFQASNSAQQKKLVTLFFSVFFSLEYPDITFQASNFSQQKLAVRFFFPVEVSWQVSFRNHFSRWHWRERDSVFLSDNESTTAT
jgi:hypothetical protein